MSNQFDGQCFRCFSGAEECASKGCGGAAPRIHPDQRAAFYATVKKTDAQKASDKVQFQKLLDTLSPSKESNEYQPCGHCKGKGVPAHRPLNCRDRLNPQSRFYEAPSLEQERMDQQRKQPRKQLDQEVSNVSFNAQPFRGCALPSQVPQFSFGGFAYPPQQMPQFNFQPVQSAFVPGGGRCITPPRPASPFNFFKGYTQMADGSWVPEK